MSAKRKFADFVCAFLAFSIVLLSIAVLTGESFFEGAVKWDAKASTLSLFGTELAFDEEVFGVLRRLVSFNGVVLGDWLSNAVISAVDFFAGYIADSASFILHLARMAVGAE